VIGINKQEGKIIWDKKKCNVENPVCIKNVYVAINEGYGTKKIEARDIYTGEIKWKIKTEAFQKFRHLETARFKTIENNLLLSNHQSSLIIDPEGNIILEMESEIFTFHIYEKKYLFVVCSEKLFLVNVISKEVVWEKDFPIGKSYVGINHSTDKPVFSTIRIKNTNDLFFFSNSCDEPKIFVQRINLVILKITVKVTGDKVWEKGLIPSNNFKMVYEEDFESYGELREDNLIIAAFNIKYRCLFNLDLNGNHQYFDLK
jgi:hypothetical protein